jgi:hypothetical protein
MASPAGDDHIEQFVLELLRTGYMLSSLVSELIEELSPDAYPGEEPAAVVIEMLCGSIRTALESSDVADVRRAAELIDRAATGTLEHLKLACELSRRMHGDGGTRRIYG